MDKVFTNTKKIDIKNIKNRIPRVSNSLFRLFEAELIDDNSTDVTAVYLLDFHLINFDCIDDIINNINTNNNTNETYSLKRLGYILVKTDLVFYLVYKKESEVMLE